MMIRNIHTPFCGREEIVFFTIHKMLNNAFSHEC